MTVALRVEVEDLASVEQWDDLVVADTDELPAQDLYLSSGLLRAVGAFAAEPFETLVARDGDEVVGALLTRQVEAGESDPRVALPDGPVPSRLVGGLYDGRTAPLVRPGLDGDQQQVVHALVEAAADLARDRGERAVVCRSVDVAATDLRAWLVADGFVESPGPNHLVMPEVPEGLTGFEAGLSGRYRNMVRREQRKLRDADVELGAEPMTAELVRESVPLVASLLCKYGQDVDDAAVAADLKMVRRSFGDSVFAVTARSAGRLVGVMELVVHRGHGFARHAGFDYDATGSLPVYFGVLFYGAFDLAHSLGLGSLDYTVGTEAAKIARGCVARPTVRMVRSL